jgi:hypothetical protein
VGADRVWVVLTVGPAVLPRRQHRDWARPREPVSDVWRNGYREVQRSSPWEMLNVRTQGGRNIYFARTIPQVFKFNLVIPSVYSGFLFVPSAVYVSLVVSFVVFIGDLFSVATRY